MLTVTSLGDRCDVPEEVGRWDRYHRESPNFVEASVFSPKKLFQEPLKRPKMKPSSGGTVL